MLLSSVDYDSCFVSSVIKITDANEDQNIHFSVTIRSLTLVTLWLIILMWKVKQMNLLSVLITQQ